MHLERWVCETRAERVADLRHAVVRYAARHGFGGEPLANIAVSVSEVVTNVVLHSRNTGATTDIAVSAESAPDGELIVRVRGAGLTPPQDDDPQLALGMVIASELARSIDVRRAASGATEVELRFQPQVLAAAS
jgi:anti-sigma regulatory factor (Ser/Thr protein kinase)